MKYFCIKYQKLLNENSCVECIQNNKSGFNDLKICQNYNCTIYEETVKNKIEFNNYI